MKKEELMKKSFYIVQEGLQIMPPAHYNAFQTVTDFTAVMVDDKIYCTQFWYDYYIKE